MGTRTWKVAALLLGSGSCALVYQIAWLRELRLVFGASTAASAAVVAIFIGGLGLGGLVLGRRADAHPRPLGFYARLETLIAASAAVTPALLWLVRETYLRAGGTLVLGPVIGTLARLALAGLVLGVPTFLMGGTLPAAARSVVTDADPKRRRLALLYGVNTLGAVAGCLAATFALLEALGTRRTLWLACGVNLLVALLARRLAGQQDGEAARRAEDAEVPQVGTAPADAPASVPSAFVLAAAAIVGFAFFLMELVWYRMLAPILGGSVYTFGLILATALLGIGLGGALWGLFGSGRPATLGGFAATCLVEALGLAIPYALGDHLAVLALRLRSLAALGFHGLVLGWSAITGIVVLPASLAAGVQFPLLIALLGRGRRDVGRQTGLAYAWNTLGAIVGSLAGGFGLMPMLTAPGCWRAVAVLLAAFGFVANALAARVGRRWLSLLAPVAVGVIAGLVAASPGPTAVWRHSGIGAGRARPSATRSHNDLRAFLSYERRTLLWEAEGVESSVSLKEIDALAFSINGKIDGNATDDAPTQVMGGLLGALLHPGVKSAMVIGLGTGSTAGWLGSLPGIERVDVVELEPAILEVARACAPVNRDVLANPKVRVRIADARETLLTTRDRYDLVFSEPSNPYRAGIASLFTLEYYRSVAARLTGSGVFLQWVQAYEVDERTVAAIRAALRSVFPVVETWQVQSGDLLMAAWLRPARYDVPTLRARVAEEPYASALRAAWRVASLEGVLARFVEGNESALTLVDANTDDRNVVEFGFARTVGARTGFSIEALREAARRRGADRPRASGGDVDWARVEDERVLFDAHSGNAKIDAPHLAPDQRRRAQAIVHYHSERFADALSAWRGQGREPSGPAEVALVAASLAATGDAAALRYVEALHALQPAEADVVVAALRLAQGRRDEAAAALEAAFQRHRSDPWPAAGIMRRALRMAGGLAASDPRLARGLFESLREPFAVRALEENRVRARVELAVRGGRPADCVEALAPLEPHVFWDMGFLSLRWNCYTDAGHPLRARARAELDEFLRH